MDIPNRSGGSVEHIAARLQSVIRERAIIHGNIDTKTHSQGG